MDLLLGWRRQRRQLLDYFAKQVQHPVLHGRDAGEQGSKRQRVIVAVAGVAQLVIAGGGVVGSNCSSCKNSNLIERTSEDFRKCCSRSLTISTRHAHIHILIPGRRATTNFARRVALCVFMQKDDRIF